MKITIEFSWPLAWLKRASRALARHRRQLLTGLGLLALVGALVLSAIVLDSARQEREQDRLKAAQRAAYEQERQKASMVAARVISGQIVEQVESQRRVKEMMGPILREPVEPEPLAPENDHSTQ